MKFQDLLGISVAVGITAIAVGFAFAGVAVQNNPITASEPELETAVKPIIIEGNFGGITDIKESIKIAFNPSDQINLDTDDGFVRATISYEGYQPQYGRVFVTVIPVNDPSNSYKSEILLSQRGNDIWETEINHHLEKSEFEADPSKLGQYVVRISTENGKTGGQAAYNVFMPSIQEESKVVPVVKEEKGQGGVLESNSAVGFDMNSLESGLENTVLKKYLGDLLEEYYDGKLTVDQVDELAKYDQINCDFVQQGNALKLECELNVEE